MFRQSSALTAIAPPPFTPVVSLFFSTTSCCYFKPSDERLLRNRGYMARQLTVFTDRSAAAENLDGGSCFITLCDRPPDSSFAVWCSFYRFRQSETDFNLEGMGIRKSLIIYTDSQKALTTNCRPGSGPNMFLRVSS